MRGSYRDLVRHSGVYGLGHVLTRLASVLLLPVYTRYLAPADYGILAILDLSVGLLAIVLASGTVRAVVRHHFETDSELERDGLWWTGLALLVATGVVLLTPLLLLRGSLASVTLGETAARGGFFFLLALCTLALSTVELLFQAHLRVHKQSTLFVGVSLGRLLVNVALNLTLLIGFGMGVAAILWGNLLTAGLSVAVLATLFARQRGPVRLRPELLGDLFSYGMPLVVASLLATAMHQLDRYLLRLLLNLNEVGIYAVAYAIGQGINSLILHPFSQIWYVVIYELDGQADFGRVIHLVFRYFFTLLALIMLGVSLFARPLLRLLVAPEFYAAADLVPVVCLAYLFFSMHAHFNLPPLLAKRTIVTVPVHLAGVLVNVGANLVLIPRLGVMGAAVASVVTYAVYALLGLAVYRRIRRFDYPLTGGALSLAGMVASYVAWGTIASWSARPVTTAAVGALVWVVWALVLALPLWTDWRRGSGPPIPLTDLGASG